MATTESAIPFEDFGGAGPALHFAHANGYPPGAYRPLLGRLAENFHVLAMRARPLWPGVPPSGPQDWPNLASDLERFLDQQKLSGLVGVGHSMGATASLRLALRQPQRFSALVLIDPVFFSPRASLLWDVAYRLGLAYRLHPLVKGALRRREAFESKEAMFDNYRSKAVFQHIDDAGLRAYVDSMATPQPDGGYTLIYPRAWEAHIYVSGVRTDMDLWRALPTLQPPLLIIRGAETNTFWGSTARRLQRRLPAAKIQTLPGATHLVPLEKPYEVNQSIQDFIRQQVQRHSEIGNSV